MSVDTPATIAVLGGGPVGLEAALYARSLGYRVELFERGRVGESLRQWGHVRMFSPFGLNASRLGLAALRAQDVAYRQPDDMALLTGAEYVERYLMPLAETDLLIDSVHAGTTVLGISREDFLKTDLPGHSLAEGVERNDSLFRILTRRADGSESEHEADVVLDATGVWGHAAYLGRGGLPALGELSCRPAIWTTIPDVLGADRERFASRRTLVVGGGYSAATVIVAIKELTHRDRDTNVVWLTRHDMSEHEDGMSRDGMSDAGLEGSRPGGAVSAGPEPIARIEADRLAARDELARAANHVARGTTPGMQHFGELWVRSIERIEAGGVERFRVRFGGTDKQHPLAGGQEFDEIVSLCGFRPDLSIVSELQVQTCYATDGSLKLAARLLDERSADCLAIPSVGVEALRHPEPDFYLLGSKSYGRNSQFLLQTGLEQIRDLFALIGDRADLNLYHTTRF